MKKIIGVVAVGVLVAAAGINAQLERAEAQKLAEQGGFTSIQEMRVAAAAGYSTKEDYDNYSIQLAATREAERQAQQALATERGFSSIEEMQTAERAGFVSKQAYEEFLVQEEARRVAEAARLAAEAEAARLAAEAEAARLATEADAARLAAEAEAARLAAEAEAARLAAEAETVRLAAQAEALGASVRREAEREGQVAQNVPVVLGQALSNEVLDGNLNEFPQNFKIYQVGRNTGINLSSLTCDNVSEMLFQESDAYASFVVMQSEGQWQSVMSTTQSCLSSSMASIGGCTESENRVELYLDQERIRIRTLFDSYPECEYYEEMDQRLGFVEADLWSEGECVHPQTSKSSQRLICAVSESENAQGPDRSDAALTDRQRGELNFAGSCVAMAEVGNEIIRRRNGSGSFDEIVVAANNSVRQLIGLDGATDVFNTMIDMVKAELETNSDDTNSVIIFSVLNECAAQYGI